MEDSVVGEEDNHIAYYQHDIREYDDRGYQKTRGFHPDRRSSIPKSLHKTIDRSLGEFLGLQLTKNLDGTYEVLTLTSISRNLRFGYYLNWPLPQHTSDSNNGFMIDGIQETESDLAKNDPEPE